MLQTCWESQSLAPALFGRSMDLFKRAAFKISTEPIASLCKFTIPWLTVWTITTTAATAQTMDRARCCAPRSCPILPWRSGVSTKARRGPARPMRRRIRRIDSWTWALGVPQRTMMTTEANLMVAMAILYNQGYILECCDGTLRYASQETILQELFLLQSIASDLIRVSCNFVPVAGAAQWH
jgi:hypothetical protein